MSILCYHEVDPNWNGPLGITPDAFARHCGWMKANRSVVDLASAVRSVGPTGRLRNGMVALTFDDGLAGLHQFALPILMKHRMHATVFLVAQTLTTQGQPVDWIDGREPGEASTLTVDDVLRMKEAGIAFGSHSYAHLDLRTLSDDEIRRDLRTSKEILEDILHEPVWCVAYPRGLHDERVRRAAKQAGFTHGLGLSFGGPATDDWGIPRIGVYARDGIAALRIKTSSWYPLLRLNAAFPIMRKAFRGAPTPTTKP